MSAPTTVGYDVALKKIAPIHVAAVHALIPNSAEFGDTFDRLFGTLEEYVTRNGKATGPYMAIYHDPGTGPLSLNMHVELAIPFEGDGTPDEQVHVYDLPGVQEAATTVHRGRFEEIDRAYNVLRAWVRDHGYRQAGPMRDVYLSCGEGDSPDYVTEVQVPITT